MPVSTEVRRQLLSAVRDARIKVIGEDLVKNDAEALLLIAVIKGYGGSPAGFIYASPTRARSNIRPPDVVLCHPDVGLLVIEAKGHVIDDIEGLEAGHIMVRYQGYTKPKSVIQQVEDQMFEIDHDMMRLVRNRREKPLSNCMAAFANISESEWRGKGYDEAYPSSQLLFRDHLMDQSRLKKRINNLVGETLKESNKEQPLTAEQINLLFQVFGNSDVINENRSPRAWVEKNKLGSEIDELVALDKYLSEEQKEYSRLPVDGHPRVIRGVAGSGKSVVLANMVARHLHRKLTSFDNMIFPDEPYRIGVTCFNNALVEFLRLKIRLAFKEQTLNENIPSDVLLVSHLNDVMWKLTKEYHWPINYLRVDDYPDSEERARRYREQIAEFAREQPDYYQALCFDAFFVDEAQDLEAEEFKLLLDLIKPSPSGEKPLIIFYDDAQNLYGRKRPNWKQDVGITVDVGDRSRVMRECFRNTSEIVELAFNLLLGTGASPDVRVRTRQYSDVAYLKERGLIQEVGDHFLVAFAERHFKKPEVQSLPSEQAELDWLAKEITRLICDEEVRPEDILVVFYQPQVFDHEALANKIRAVMPELQFILPFGKRADKRSYIFREGCLTISTVYGAKGYDAPVVFVAGVDRFEYDLEGRAAFYVAATRAKLLLYVSGVTRSGDTLLTEAQKVIEVI